MANTPEKQQIVPEDFNKDDQDVASKIAGPFNTYVEQLDEILNRNLTFGDNLRCDLKTITVVGGSPITFRYGQSDRPVGLWVVSYTNLDNASVLPTVAVQAQWLYDGKGNITISSLIGLTAGVNYSVTIIAISG